MRPWLFKLCVFPLICGIPVFAATTPDSRSVQVSTGRPARILLIEGGYIGMPSVANNTNQNFSTTKKCPPNFTPFITMEIGKIMYTRVGRDYLSAYSACIYSLTPTATNYSVAYRVIHFWGEVAASSNNNTFISRSSATFTLFDTQAMFSTQNYGGFTGDHQSVAALSWRLYCYPPNLTTPRNQLAGVADCLAAHF